MGRVIKTISLDKTSAKICENIPNFSQWIRMQLLVWWQLEGNEPIHVLPRSVRNYSIQVWRGQRDQDGRRVIEPHNTEKCNPYHVKGKCPICWPEDKTPEQHIIDIMEVIQEGGSDGRRSTHANVQTGGTAPKSNGEEEE